MADVTITRPYPGGWKDLPLQLTDIDGAALDQIEANTQTVLDRANDAHVVAEAAWTASIGAVADQRYFVSKSGSDTNSGQAPGAAFLTLAAAAAAAAGTGAQVNVGVGTWREDLTVWDSLELVGRSNGLTLIQSPPGSSSPGTLTLPAKVVQSLRLRDLRVFTANAGQHGLYFDAEQQFIDGLWQGGLWGSVFKNLNVGSTSGIPVYLRGGGIGWSTITTTAGLSTGSPITSLPFAAPSVGLSAGQTIRLVSGANTQVFTVSTNTSGGTNPVPVNSITPNFAYPTSTTVLFARSSCPIQFLDFENCQINSLSTQPCAVFSGQTGQINLDAATQFNGQGATGGGAKNVQILRETLSATDLTQISSQACYNINFLGTTNQHADYGWYVDAGYGINIDNPHVESMYVGASFNNGTKAKVSGGTWFNVAKGDGSGALVQANGGSVVVVDGEPYQFGTIEKTIVADSTSSVLHGGTNPTSGLLQVTSGVVKSIGVNAQGLLNLGMARHAAVSSGTAIGLLTCQAPVGVPVYLTAVGGPFTLQLTASGGGTIDAASNNLVLPQSSITVDMISGVPPSVGGGLILSTAGWQFIHWTGVTGTGPYTLTGVSGGPGTILTALVDSMGAAFRYQNIGGGTGTVTVPAGSTATLVRSDRDQQWHLVGVYP